jgi:hypothetical protein
VKDGCLGVGVTKYEGEQNGLHGFALSRCDGGFERSGNSVFRNFWASGTFSRGEIGSIGDDVGFVEVEMVEILARVGSCKKDACDKKSDGDD